LIEIGSKTAEKNFAQTNRQTNKQTDTTKIIVTWPWTNTTSLHYHERITGLLSWRGVLSSDNPITPIPSAYVLVQISFTYFHQWGSYVLPSSERIWLH